MQPELGRIVGNSLLAFVGLFLLFHEELQASLARDYGVFFAAVGSLCGRILFLSRVAPRPNPDSSGRFCWRHHGLSLYEERCVFAVSLEQGAPVLLFRRDERCRSATDWVQRVGGGPIRLELRPNLRRPSPRKPFSRRRRFL